VHTGAHYLVEQQVAGELFGTAVKVKEVRLQAIPPGRGRRYARMIGLQPAKGDQSFVAALNRFG
jgi:hypothetical protein